MRNALKKDFSQFATSLDFVEIDHADQLRIVRQLIGGDYGDERVNKQFEDWVLSNFPKGPLQFAVQLVGQEAVDLLIEETLEQSYEDHYEVDPIRDIEDMILGRKMEIDSDRATNYGQRAYDTLSSDLETRRGGRKEYVQTYAKARTEVCEVNEKGVLVHHIVDEVPETEVKGYEPDEQFDRGMLIPYYRINGKTVLYREMVKELTNRSPGKGWWLDKPVQAIYMQRGTKRKLGTEVEIMLRDGYDEAVELREQRKAAACGQFVPGLYDESNKAYGYWDTMRKAMMDYRKSAAANALETMTTVEGSFTKVWYFKHYPKGNFTLMSPVVKSELADSALERGRQELKALRMRQWQELNDLWAWHQELIEIDLYLQDHDDDFVRDVFEVELKRFYNVVRVRCPWHLFRKDFKGNCAFLGLWRNYVLRLVLQSKPIAYDDIPMI